MRAHRATAVIKTAEVHALISALQMAGNPRVRLLAAVVLSDLFS